VRQYKSGFQKPIQFVGDDLVVGPYMNTCFSRLNALAILVCTIIASLEAIAEPSPNYIVTQTILLGAPDRWDYLAFDDSVNRVYVAHGDRVTVVDVKAGKVIGQVEGIPGGTHGIGISLKLGIGITDDGRAGTVAIFDLATLKVRKTLQVDKDADGIVFDKSSGHFFVINGDSGTVTVIDPKSEQTIGTIKVGGKLEFGATDDAGKLYINGAEKREVIRIDTSTNQVDAHWPITNCASPHGIAIDTELHRLFASCINNVLVVVNTGDGSIVAALSIGSGTDAAAFDPKRKLIFSSNGHDGTLTVIKEVDAQTYNVVANIKTAVTARTMTIDPNAGRLFLAAAEIDSQGKASNGRPQLISGSLKLLVMDPVP
jgi:YVTN family beta-propeller protein